jgi:hypothetical protein
MPEGQGAPIQITWTGFPGLYLRYGSHVSEPYPDCGCDACGGDASTAGREFRRDLEAVVEGRFSEYTHGGEAAGFRMDFEPGWWRGAGREDIPAHEREEHRWPAWPAR